MDKVRIGFVGVGFMGQMAHLRNYVTLPDCEVVAIAEPREKLRAAVAARYGIPRTFATHKELLAECKLDGIVASQPYNRHAVLLPELMESRLPVFTEKPIAVSVDAGAKLAELSKKNGVMYMVGYHKRSDPAMEYAKKIIDEWKASHEYGPMRLVRAVMPPGDWIANGGQGFVNTDEPYPPCEWEPQPADMDKPVFDAYNGFVNYYIHQVNAIRFLLGESYKVTYADKSGVLMAGESASGVSATLEMAAFNTTREWLESYLVAFERGYVLIELPAPLTVNQAGRVTIMRDKGWDHDATHTSPMLHKRHAMLCQAGNFVAAIKGERPAPCLAAEAVEDLKVARDYIRLKMGQ